MTHSAKILCVEDELQIRRLLKITLQGAGFQVLEAANLAEGRLILGSHRPDLVLLDLKLPDGHGLGFLQELRQWTETPCLVLTAHHEEALVIDALDLGADDFITKPFLSGELLARIRAALRRRTPPSLRSVWSQENLTVEFTSRQVKVGGENIHMTSTEYDLLCCFLKHCGKALTHRQILREVWGPHAESQTQYLRVYINHLRHKLEPSGGRTWIETLPGVGYRFIGEAALPSAPTHE